MFSVTPIEEWESGVLGSGDQGLGGLESRGWAEGRMETFQGRGGQVVSRNGSGWAGSRRQDWNSAPVPDASPVPCAAQSSPRGL